MIPRILHHIWLHPRPMSSQFLQSLRAWREHHPTWEQFIWTEGRLPVLRYSSAFYSLNEPDDRAELLRWELLAQFGGFSVAEDVEPLRPWDTIAENEDAIQVRDGGVLCLMATSPRHAFAEWALQTGFRLAGRHRSEPGAWQIAFHRALGASDARSESFVEGPAWIQKSPKELPAYSPQNLVIAVRTIAREPQYIHETLASMFLSDESIRQTGQVLLLVGNESPDYLHNYFHHRHLRVLPLTASERARFRSIGSPHRRCSLNFFRSLQLPLDGKIGVLSCEDDVVFRDDYLRLLLAAVQEMEEEHGLSDYMLSLAQYYDFELSPEARTGRYFCRYDKPFYGLQAVYLPTASARALARCVEVAGINEYLGPCDLLAAEYMQGRTFALNRPLVQHIGGVSTGLGGTSLDKTLFLRPFVPLSPAEWGTPARSIECVAQPWSDPPLGLIPVPANSCVVTIVTFNSLANFLRNVRTWRFPPNFPLTFLVSEKVTSSLEQAEESFSVRVAAKPEDALKNPGVMLKAMIEHTDADSIVLLPSGVSAARGAELFSWDSWENYEVVWHVSVPLTTEGQGMDSEGFRANIPLFALLRREAVERMLGQYGTEEFTAGSLTELVMRLSAGCGLRVASVDMRYHGWKDIPSNLCALEMDYVTSARRE
jgi:hypothetical protein